MKLSTHNIKNARSAHAIETPVLQALPTHNTLSSATHTPSTLLQHTIVITLFYVYHYRFNLQAIRNQ